MPLAIVTGGSKGLGYALGRTLVERNWDLIVDARTSAALAVAWAGSSDRVTTVPGDVTHPLHRAALATVVGERPLDLLVNNASRLGPSPQPQLASYPLDELRQTYETNVVAPLALIQLLLPALQRSPRPTIVNVTSDASVEPYAGWGGYGSSKAALDQLTRILAEEQPRICTYAFDPGDMRTDLHQAAFPGEDISDRPDPTSVVPALLQLIEDRRASGRIRAADLTAVGERR